MSQLERVREHLKVYGAITSWQAFKTYRITRLSAITHRLRQDGMNIISIPCKKHVIYELKKRKA